MRRRRIQRALVWGMVLTLGAWGSRRAGAQGPTIEPGAARPAPGAEGSSLGPAPGSGASTLQNAPGANEPLSGRLGPSVPRVPSAVTTPGVMNLAPEGAAIRPTRVLPSAELPVYGTLDFPSVEDIGPADGMTLDHAIDRLVHENLDLRGQFLEITLADADILTASLRANPVFYADSQLIPYGQYTRQRPGGQTQYDVNISYPLDISRKRRARMVSAHAAKHVVEAQYQDAVRIQIDNLYTAYVDALAARQYLRYSEESLKGLDQILKPNEAKFRLGAITEAVVNRIRIQRESAAIGVFDAQETFRRTQRTLATLLNIPPDQTLTLEVRGTLADRAEKPVLGDDLVRLAVDNRPDLNAFRLGIRRAEADVRLQKANAFSDVYVLYQPYTFQNNQPFGLKSPTSWALGVTVPLPVYNRNQGNIRRARFNVTQSETEMLARLRQVITEVQQAEREYLVSLEAVNRINNYLRPAATQVYRTAERRYYAGQEDVTILLGARQEFNQVVKQYLDTLIRHRRSMLDLNTAAGLRLLP